MRKEIAAVMFFLKRLVKVQKKLESEKIDLFAERLAVALQEKFRGHWYPDNPSRGQACRCIRVNPFSTRDPELLRACRESGVPYSDLGLPVELTLWVDPGEVSGRYDERHPSFSIATFPNDAENVVDTAKKVTSAVERVTSDYHSDSSEAGSSSSSPLATPKKTCQLLNPAAPPWHPSGKTPATIPLPSQSPHGSRSRGFPPVRRSTWRPPPYTAGPPNWGSDQTCGH